MPCQLCPPLKAVCEGLGACVLQPSCKQEEKVKGIADTSLSQQHQTTSVCP